MHPHWYGNPHHHYYHSMRRCGPHRLFWFILGAGSAAFFIKQRESRKGQYYEQCYQRRSALENSPGPTVSAPPPSHTPTPLPSQGWNQDLTEPESAAPSNSSPTKAPWGFSNREEWDKHWEHEKERAWSLSKQAGDTMSELSEATLDSVLSTVEALKQRLKEHKEERERERKALEKEREEKRNSRLV